MALVQGGDGSWPFTSVSYRDLQGLIAPMLEACKALELGLSGRLVGGGAAADAATDGTGRHLGLPAHQTARRAVWCAVPFASINSCSAGGGSSRGAASTSKAAVGILGSGLTAPGEGQQAELTPALRALSGTWFKVGAYAPSARDQSLIFT